jgi:hypothetical protein
MLAQFRRSPKARVLVFGILFGVAGVLFAGTALLRPSHAPAQTASSGSGAPRTFDVALDDSRKVTGFVARYGQRIDETRRELSEKNAEIQELRTSLKTHSEALAKLTGEMEGLRTRELVPAAHARPGEASSQGGAAGETAAAPGLPRLEKISLPAAAKAQAAAARKDEVRIPAGSFAEATLLTGVYAPTDGGAQPVDLRVDLTFIGPNRSRIPVQECFLIGKATGDPNSLRVVIQVDRLSFVRKDGRAIEVPLNGFVADQDGVMGLAGQYVWRIGESLFLAGGLGAIQGVANAFGQGQTTTQINPLGGATQIVTGDPLKFAAAGAGSTATNKMGDIVTKRLDQIIPAVYTENGRKLTVILIDGVTLTGLDPKEVQNDSSRSPYQGLDFDR